MKSRSWMTLAAASAAITSWTLPVAAQTRAPQAQRPPVVHAPNVRISPLRPGLHRPYRESAYSLLFGAAPLGAAQQYAAIMGFADCAANVSPALSARLLAAEPGSGEAAVISRQLRGISRGCAPAGSFLPTSFFRSALAETLYRRAGGADTARLAPELHAKPAAVATVAECLFVQSPASVDSLLRTTPGTAAEEAALDRLAPFARKCTVGGQPVTLAQSEPFLRSGLAEMAYQSITRTNG